MSENKRECVKVREEGEIFVGAMLYNKGHRRFLNTHQHNVSNKCIRVF